MYVRVTMFCGGFRSGTSTSSLEKVVRKCLARADALVLSSGHTVRSLTTDGILADFLNLLDTKR